MRRIFLSALLFFGFSLGSCSSEDTPCCPVYPPVIFGHWDIKGGGTLYFEVGRFSTSVGCNTLFGEVDITEESLGFSLIATTLMACPEEEDEREQELATLFDSATLTYKLIDNQAILFNSQGDIVLTLIRPINANFVNDWVLQSIRTENGTSSSILDQNTGITFLADGNVEVVTACNSGRGNYSIINDVLQIQGIALTEMGCDEERNTRQNEMIAALTEINGYSILRKSLSLEKDGVPYLSFQLRE